MPTSLLDFEIYTRALLSSSVLTSPSAAPLVVHSRLGKGIEHSLSANFTVSAFDAVIVPSPVAPCVHVSLSPSPLSKTTSPYCFVEISILFGKGPSNSGSAADAEATASALIAKTASSAQSTILDMDLMSELPCIGPAPGRRPLTKGPPKAGLLMISPRYRRTTRRQDVTSSRCGHTYVNSFPVLHG